MKTLKKITSSDYTYIIEIMSNCPTVIPLLMFTVINFFEGKKEGGAKSGDKQRVFCTY